MTSTRITNSSDAIVAQTQVAYDEGSYMLPSYGTVMGWTDPQTNPRGLPTTTRSWLDTTNTWPETHIHYDRCGSPRKATDARGYVSEVLYDSANHYAYPTSTISPDPDGAGPLTAHTTSTVYDLPSGAVTFAIDANNRTSTFEYAATDTLGNSNPMQRLTRVVRADGGWTAYGYSDQPGDLFVRTRAALDASRNIESTQYLDGLGRGWRAVKSEGATSIYVDTQYDTMGRPWKVSNPYRGGETTLWTTTGFDALGRVLTVTTPDNSVVATSYSGNTVTVTDQDQIGKKRKSVTDALGRLREVYEDPTDLNYLTSYSYDVLDSLTTVTQGTQTRTFVYDSLKRLKSATNPESGTINYDYDNNGNLTQKTDARGVVSSYLYDALNRVTNRSYVMTDGLLTTPAVTYAYDQAPRDGYFNRGRLTTVTTARVDTTPPSPSPSPLTSVEYDYDPMGRVTSQRQTGWLYTPASSAVYDLEAFLITNVSAPIATELINQASTTYWMAYSYNLAGALISQTYPSGHTVNYAYDSAGRTSSFTGNLGDGNQRNYATGITYSPFGGPSQEQFGSTIPIYNKLFYNSRQQLSEILASTTANDSSWNRGKILNQYSLQCSGASCNATDNNGNLRKQETFIPYDDQVSSTSWYQEFDYDNLNRLEKAKEFNSDGTQLWQQQYDYDRWGNRTIDQGNTSVGINNKQFAVNTANNRLGVPNGQSGVMTYDDAGNLTTDTYTGAGERTYDAENRMTTALGANNQQQVYSYDGEGRRVQRKVDGVETWQVYSFDGQLLAEYAANGAAQSPLKEYGYRNGQLLITAEAPVNVALASQGSVATASSSRSNFPAAAAINGDRTGATWGNPSGGWNDGTRNAYPDILEVEFRMEGTPSPKTIDEIDVFTLQNNWTTAGEPTLTTPATGEGILDFIVQYCSANCGTTPTWTAVTGGNVTGNDKAWRQFKFSTVTTTKIRVVVTNSRNNWSRIVEVEAYKNRNSVVQWLAADQLGTPRMIFDETGSLANVKRHDYLPFGEELGAGVGGRTTEQGYVGDNVRQKFTQKERDIETGLDFFEARYYSSLQGRFTSVDPENAGAALWHPQSWNGYAYSLNNPLRFVDPDGLRWAQIGVDGGLAYRWFDDNEKDDNGQTEYGRALANGYSAVTFDESKAFSFTNGLLAPGETLTTVTLNPDGSGNVSNHTVTLGEYSKLLALYGMVDTTSSYMSALGLKPSGGFDKLLSDFVSSIVGTDTNISANLPNVPGPAVGSTLTKSEQRKLGNLASRAKEKVADVIRSRGGTGANVRQAGPWAEKTLAETAKAATSGDRAAATAIKIAKQAGRLGQKH